MPKISEERRIERREQILAGARRAFAEHGYEGATVARLEKATGMSRGAIFTTSPPRRTSSSSWRGRDNERLIRLWLARGWEPRYGASSRTTRTGSASTWR